MRSQEIPADWGSFREMRHSLKQAPSVPLMLPCGLAIVLVLFNFILPSITLGFIDINFTV